MPLSGVEGAAPAVPEERPDGSVEPSGGNGSEQQPHQTVDDDGAPDPWADYLRDQGEDGWDWRANRWSEDWSWNAWGWHSWGQRSEDGWGPTQAGWLRDAQMRGFHVASLQNTTALEKGCWVGSHGTSTPHAHSDLAPEEKGKPTEKLTVPEFDGEGGSDAEVGREARILHPPGAGLAEVHQIAASAASASSLHVSQGQGMDICRRTQRGPARLGAGNGLLPGVAPDEVHGS